MGPRHKDRGERNPFFFGVWACTSFNGATAQRPWRTRCVLNRPSRPIRLQWGHGTKTVENDGCGTDVVEAIRKLQWGHGTKTVENYKTLQWLRGLPELQWGHGTKTVENSLSSTTPT